MKNEDYFPEESVVKDSIYMLMKDTITCSLCNKIIKNPMMCTNCQKTYCKNCLNNWVNTCPNNCANPQYIKSLGVIDILSKLKYECQNCGKQIKSEDIKSHLDSNCVKILKKAKTLAEEFKTKKTLRKLTTEEAEKMRNEGKEISYLSSKKKSNFYIYFSYYIRKKWCWKNIFNKYVIKYFI